jgi:BirA family transcriptional regulator, biotin operon repressor / biotin---[acetyl-CoA-carboxylase] ligase
VASSLAPEFVVPRLRGRLGHPYLYVETCASTQRLFGPEHGEGAVAVAEEQSEGRGRLGRHWHSPPGVSVLCSVLLEPPVETQELPGLTLVAGEAAAEAIASVTGLEPRIKLPNDILLGGKKAAGILAEAREGRVILGIGINANLAEDQLPTEVELPATSLLVESGREADRADLLVELLAVFERRYDDWAERRR